MGDWKGAIVPSGLTGSMFHHINNSMAYKLAISTEKPFPCGKQHLYFKRVTKMSVIVIKKI
jgi:hypothetical protein